VEHVHHARCDEYLPRRCPVSAHRQRPCTL
jgi:hypothetical protein